MDKPHGKQGNESLQEATNNASATFTHGPDPDAGPVRVKSNLPVGKETSDGFPTLPPSPDNGPAFASLERDEKQIIAVQLDSPSVGVNYFTLYRYADSWDCLIIAISAISAIAAGAILPLLSVRRTSTPCHSVSFC